RLLTASRRLATFTASPINRRRSPGTKAAQGIDRDLRVGGRSCDLVIGGEQALPFAAEQRRTDDRNNTENGVQSGGRDDRPLQVEPVAARSATPLPVTPIAPP